jgi:hypothetical protein
MKFDMLPSTGNPLELGKVWVSLDSWYVKVVGFVPSSTISSTELCVEVCVELCLADLSLYFAALFLSILNFFTEGELAREQAPTEFVVGMDIAESD